MSKQQLNKHVSGDFATILDLFDEVVRLHGDREAIVEGDKRLTFAELARRADVVAQWLINEREVAPGDVVALQLRPGIAFAVAFHAAIRAGAVATAIDLRLSTQQRQQIVERCQPRFVFDEMTTAPNAGINGDPLARRVQLAKTDPVAIAWRFEASGTATGAWFDHVCLKAVTRGSAPLSALGDRHLSLSVWADQHCMTSAWDNLAHLVTTIVAPSDSSADQIIELIAAEQVTVCHGNADHYATLVNASAPGSLRLASITSGLVNPGMATTIRDRFHCDVVVRYSPPGAALATGTRLADSLATITTTVGRNNGGVELRLVDELGTDLTGRGADFVGSILLRSRAMLRGYWHDEALTNQRIDEDGWLDTGDLGWIGADGNLRLCGPTSAMYIHAGNDVYPVEVERCLSEYRKLAATAVIGVPVRHRVGEIGVLFAEPAAGAVLKFGDLRTFVSKQLAPYKAPACLVVLERLPRDSYGEIDRNGLQQQASEAAANWLAAAI